MSNHKADSFKRIMEIVLPLVVLILIPISFYEYITGNSNWIYYAILTGIIALPVATKFTDEKNENLSQFKGRLSSENNHDTVLNYNAKYLGGHPEKIITTSISGIVGVSESKLGFTTEFPGGTTFDINLIDITEVSEETKESLTLGRFLLVGVLAFALKKKENYVRVSFRNGIGEVSTIIFETPEAKWITQLITQKRYNCIAMQQKNKVDIVLSTGSK